MSPALPRTLETAAPATGEVTGRGRPITDRGRDARCRAPPAQTRTRGTTASGSYHRYKRRSVAASRTRCSSLLAFPRLCVRFAFRCLGFSAVERLPSTKSASAVAVLFPGFVGTMRSCDFSWPFISGLRPWPSLCGSSAPSAESNHEISRFSRAELIVYMRCSSTAPGSVWLSRLPIQSDFAFRTGPTASAPGSVPHFAAQSHRLHTPCQRFGHALTTTAA